MATTQETTVTAAVLGASLAGALALTAAELADGRYSLHAENWAFEDCDDPGRTWGLEFDPMTDPAPAPPENPVTEPELRRRAFLETLWLIEASLQHDPPDGDGGRSIGPLQISRAYWQDANVPGSWDDCRELGYACEVVEGYMRRYAPRAWERCESDDAVKMARLHNGGPRGHKKEATEAYGEMFRALFEDEVFVQATQGDE